MKQFKRDKIRLYAFLTACLITLILLSAFGVSAESNNGVTESSESTGDYWRVYGSVDSYDTFVSNYSDKGLVSDYVSLDGVFHQGDLNDSFWGSVSSSNSNLVDYIDSDQERQLLNNFNNLYIPLVSKLTYQNNYCFLRYIGGAGGTDTEYNLVIVNTDGDNFDVVGDGRYSGLFTCNSNQGVVLSVSFVVGGSFNGVDVNSISLKSYWCTANNWDASPVYPPGMTDAFGSVFASYYYKNDRYNAYGIYRDIIASNIPLTWLDTNYPSGYTEPSYLPPIATISGGSGGSSNGESELNNLYFPSSDFKWRVEQYGIVYDWPSGSGTEFAEQALSNADRNMLKKSNWGSGAVDFTAVLTDYQKEHADEFKIKFKFMCWMKYFLPSANTAIEGSSWTGYYIFATNPYEVDVSLSTFISDGNIKTFTLSDIFSNLNITSTNTQFTTTIQGAYRQLFEEEYLLWDNSTELGWKLQATAQLYPTDNNLNESSGYNTETYNLLTQISKQTEDSLSDNEYPYTPDDETNENTPDLGGGNNSQSVTSGNGQITVTNNDNDVININDGNAETVEDIYNDLTSSDGEDSLSERFVNLVNENAWITIMQETFSFIPSSIWVSLEIFVVTALGILAASFVLRIILDLL